MEEWKEPLIAILGGGRVPLAPSLAGWCPKGTTLPHTPGAEQLENSRHRVPQTVLPAGLAQHGRTLSWTPKVTRSSSSSVLSGTHLQAAQMEQVGRFPRQQKQPF